jgi:hypothetical protein
MGIVVIEGNVVNLVNLVIMVLIVFTVFVGIKVILGMFLWLLCF